MELAPQMNLNFVSVYRRDVLQESLKMGRSGENYFFYVYIDDVYLL